MQPQQPQQPPGGGTGMPWSPQQPPPRPPYGQVPYGQAPGYSPIPPKTKAPLIVAAVAIAVVLGVLVIIIVIKEPGSRISAQPSSAVAGDCIKVNSASADDADVEKIDCAAPEAVYKVGKEVDGAGAQCPSDSYVSYIQSGRGRDFTLCLMLNAAEGDCFSHVTSGITAKVVCSAADAEARTDKVVNGEASESACPQDVGLALVYPEPGETICLSQVTPA